MGKSVDQYARDNRRARLSQSGREFLAGSTLSNIIVGRHAHAGFERGFTLRRVAGLGPAALAARVYRPGPSATAWLSRDAGDRHKHHRRSRFTDLLFQLRPAGTAYH